MDAVIYKGEILDVKDFLKEEIRIAIERWDVEDGVRTLSMTHFEPDPFTAFDYLMDQIEYWKGNAPEEERPKFELKYADKYGNIIR